ncbi:DUF2818 family protein [Alkalilimnicola ehrlichii MLHE-1]|uniref:Transmembrane protein n=1 Tax=Alkalilimnicola ehrlichii (strain ATCC BAA-1101 / DSM 17681 / MLHE-1) TaxID=187272 RepID=Q0A789_ALKEH|nr:DUF2818 family protein [Alkalilimnicola ehrlichii]ABI57298.1 conserved hypothetical protein [Alkalilimnicola ehrlichii MLHE-1]
MGENSAIALLFLLAVVAANLPWLTERVFLVAPTPPRGKREWVRFLEWGVYYLVAGAAAIGLEYSVTGDIYPKDWVFYVTTLCLFAVFALPGFIYRHDLRKHLQKRKERSDRLRRAASQD